MDEFGKSSFERNEKVIKLLKVFCIIAIFIIIFGVITINYPKCAAENGSSYVVMYQPGRQVLSGNNLDARLPMASTTKIVTAIVTLENASLDEVVTIPKEAVGVEGSSVYLRGGEKFTVNELWLTLWLESGQPGPAVL